MLPYNASNVEYRPHFLRIILEQCSIELRHEDLNGGKQSWRVLCVDCKLFPVYPLLSLTAMISVYYCSILVSFSWMMIKDLTSFRLVYIFYRAYERRQNVLSPMWCLCSSLYFLSSCWFLVYSKPLLSGH